jgi:5-methylcytosine-specific restriction endonuclease McrA
MSSCHYIKMEDVKKKIKTKIPKALREQVWLKQFGKTFKHKCHVTWCKNEITVFDFECGHNTPESKGGLTNLSNLLPLCSRCNKSMGNRYTITEWIKLGASGGASSPFSWCC